MKRSTTRVLTALCVSALGGHVAAARPHFDGEISRPALERHLSRAITMMDLLTGRGNPDDNIRMLKDVGAKFAGRTIYCWGGERRLAARLATARKIAPKVHAADPDIILQAAVFEIVTTDVNRIAVPACVFKAFGLKPEQRNFRYDAMCFPDGRFRDHWSKGASVPDMTQTETKLWFYYLAIEYIDVGCEAIHFGQVALIGAADKDHAHWWDMLSRVRQYAKGHARRGLVLCDAHTPRGGPRTNGNRLLFDFHSFPLRIDEIAGRPHEGVLRVGYLDAIYGKSNGGITPSGWRCDHLPYIVELDNFERTGKEGKNVGHHWCWGWDEICWFANQPTAYRNRWLRYAWKWVRQHDANGYLQMPGSRCLASGAKGSNGERTGWYFANRPSQAVPTGFDQESTIKSIWSRDALGEKKRDLWRGVHVMAWGPAGGPKAIPPLKRAITDVLLPLGVNVIVFEVDYNFAFKSHPELRYDEVITKTQARDLAAFCRKHGVRLIPQFNCLGHQSWVRQDVIFPLMTEYPELEEIPDLPPEKAAKRLKSWCPLHPKVNEIVFALMDELIDAFEADAFHVGMDEVLTIASPKCPRCRGKDPADLFARAVNDYHQHLVQERGLTMLMWGDRLLDSKAANMGRGWEASHVGTAPAIDRIPKDIIICDWHYSLQDEYPSIRHFQERGFRVWPSTWKNVKATEAVVVYAHRHATQRMLGHLCTSWVLKPGLFAQALLGEGDPEALKSRATPAAAAVRAAMHKLDEVWFGGSK